jgi:hypothetical protein
MLTTYFYMIYLDINLQPMTKFPEWFLTFRITPTILHVQSTIWNLYAMNTSRLICETDYYDNILNTHFH